MPHLDRPHRAGFTLVEVLVALSIMAMIGMIAFATISTTLHARDYLERDVRFGQRQCFFAASAEDEGVSAFQADDV